MDPIDLSILFQTVTSNHLYIDIDIMRIPFMMERENVCINGTPVFNMPIIYANQDYTDNLGIQSDVVRVYPSKPRVELLHDHTIFLLRRTEKRFITILEDKRTELRKAKDCLATSYDWFETNRIYKKSVEAHVQVFPGLDVKPMY